MAPGPITSWQINGETVTDFLFSGAPKSLQMVTAAMKLKDACSLEEKFDQPRQHIKKQRHYFANKCPSSQSYGFSGSRCFLGDSEVKASACNVGDQGSIPVSGRSPGEGNGNPLQYSCLENPMEGRAW